MTTVKSIILEGVLVGKLRELSRHIEYTIDELVDFDGTFKRITDHVEDVDMDELYEVSRHANADTNTLYETVVDYRNQMTNAMKQTDNPMIVEVLSDSLNEISDSLPLQVDNVVGRIHDLESVFESVEPQLQNKNVRGMASVIHSMDSLNAHTKHLVDLTQQVSIIINDSLGKSVR